METNRHHLWWNRAKYKSPEHKRLRAFGGFVFRMAEVVHKDLHGELEQPPYPDTQLARGILHLAHQSDQVGIDRVLYVAEHCLQRDDRHAQRVGHHLLKQVGFLIEGEVCPRSV